MVLAMGGPRKKTGICPLLYFSKSVDFGDSPSLQFPATLSSALDCLAKSGGHCVLTPLNVCGCPPKPPCLAPPSGPFPSRAPELRKVRRLAKVTLLGWALREVEGCGKAAIHQVPWDYFIPANRSCWFAIWRVWPQFPWAG